MCQTSKRSVSRLTSSACGFLPNTLALAVVLSGFGQAVAAAVPESEPSSPTGLSEVEMVAVMEAHYNAAIAGHDALIRGDLETLHRRLAELETQALPPAAPQSWEPYQAQLREAARGAAAVTSVNTAGPVMAAVAEACGSCHAAVQAGKIYFWPAPPEGEDKLETAMRTHQWATERLWEGVTGPFDAAWERGAAALAEAQVFGAEGEAVESGLRAREAALQELGRSAQATIGLHERALVYGRLLSTCAECHRAAGVTIQDAKPVPPWRK